MPKEIDDIGKYNLKQNKTHYAEILAYTVHKCSA